MHHLSCRCEGKGKNFEGGSEESEDKSGEITQPNLHPVPMRQSQVRQATPPVMFIYTPTQERGSIELV